MRVSSIGEYIKEQREQAKISLRQLAAAAGVSNPYLSQIERGLRRPSAEILQQIAKGLRISAEVLYVQAGAFVESRNAERLLVRLKAAGLSSAFVASPIEGSSHLYRVRLGPVGSVAEFDALTARLTALGIADARLALE